MLMGEDGADTWDSRGTYFIHTVRVSSVRFGSVRLWGWNGSSGSGFSVPAVPLGRGFSVFQFSLTGTVPVSVPRIRDQKCMGMAMFKRTFGRTIPDNLRAPHMKMWGFEAKRARKFTQTSP